MATNAQSCHWLVVHPAVPAAQTADSVRLCGTGADDHAAGWAGPPRLARSLLRDSRSE